MSALNRREALLLVGGVLGCACQRTEQSTTVEQPIAPRAPLAERLAATGFETGITLTGPADSGNRRLFQARLVGSDVPDSVWPPRLWNASSEYFFMAADRELDDISAVMTTRIEEVASYRGTPTRALYMDVRDGERDAQNDYYIAELEERPSMYFRYRLRLDDSIPTAAKHRDYWRAIFTLKTAGDYRIAAGIYPDNDGTPFWFAHADNNANGRLPPDGAYDEFWTCANRRTPVVSGRWTLVELYWERDPTSRNGVFFWAINGQPIVAYCGSMYGAENAAINRIMPFMVYASRSGLPASQLVDDFEAWELPPCVALPCVSRTEQSAQRESYRTAVCASARQAYGEQRGCRTISRR